MRVYVFGTPPQKTIKEEETVCFSFGSPFPIWPPESSEAPEARFDPSRGLALQWPPPRRAESLLAPPRDGEVRGAKAGGGKRSPVQAVAPESGAHSGGVDLMLSDVAVGQNRFGITCWAIGGHGEFTPHFRTYCSGWIGMFSGPKVSQLLFLHLAPSQFTPSGIS